MMVFQSIHYDMEDLIEQANEIQESLSRTYGVPDEVDEADLQAGERATSGSSSQMRGV
jgi:charged multivesicular body protein 5